MSQSATPTNRLFEVRLVETIRSHAYVLAPTHEAAGRLTPSQAHTLKRKAIFTGRTLKIASIRPATEASAPILTLTEEE